MNNGKSGKSKKLILIFLFIIIIILGGIFIIDIIKYNKLPPKIDSCPGCVYSYIDKTVIYTSWSEKDHTILNKKDYDENYKNIIKKSRKKVFLGMVLDSNRQITRAYACGIKDNVPFCVEQNKENSTYNSNLTLLQSNKLYANQCKGIESFSQCKGSIEVYIGMGDVSVSEPHTYMNMPFFCWVTKSGAMSCERDGIIYAD